MSIFSKHGKLPTDMLDVHKGTCKIIDLQTERPMVIIPCLWKFQNWNLILRVPRINYISNRNTMIELRIYDKFNNCIGMTDSRSIMKEDHITIDT